MELVRYFYTCEFLWQSCFAGSREAPAHTVLWTRSMWGKVSIKCFYQICLILMCYGACWNRPFVPGEMAMRNLGEPNSHCASFTSHSKFVISSLPKAHRMGSETSTMAIGLTQIPHSHLTVHQWPVPSMPTMVFAVYSVGMQILNND